MYFYNEIIHIGFAAEPWKRDIDTDGQSYFRIFNTIMDLFLS